MPIRSIFNKVKDLPTRLGPFSHAQDVEGGFLYISGHGPYDPNVGKFVCNTIAEQTTLSFACIERLLKKAGARRDQVVNCRIYIDNIDEESYEAMNGAYSLFFGDHRPTRNTIGATLLDIGVEIECVACLE